MALLPLFAGCSVESEADIRLLPDNGVRFILFPNDLAQNDSISKNLAHGVRILVHPNASYELSFDADGKTPPILQLFRLFEKNDTLYAGNKVRELEGRVVNGRVVYDFVCEENEATYWATSLLDDDTFYNRPTPNVKLVADGFYSDHFSINLIAVGKIKPTADSVDVDGLANLLLQAFRKYYTSVTIDTIYVRYAHEHPTLGYKYPANEPWLAGKSSEDMYLSELGGWPEKEVESALDIVYMHRIEQDGILGYASLYSGNLRGGDKSTVIIGNRVRAPEVGGEASLLAREIVETALHETGHFFGLRHTTSTLMDFESTGDYSNAEDGIADTKVCLDLLLSEGWAGRMETYYAAGNKTITKPDLQRIYKFDSDALSMYEKCPDARNYMFPMSTTLSFEGFSKQQLEIIRKNLMIFPH